MSKIKNGGLDQYGAEPFEQQQFETAGVEGVKLIWGVLTLIREQQMIPVTFDSSCGYVVSLNSHPNTVASWNIAESCNCTCHKRRCVGRGVFCYKLIRSVKVAQMFLCVKTSDVWFSVFLSVCVPVSYTHLTLPTNREV